MKMRRKPHAKEAACQDCGTVYVKSSSSQVRCAACSAIRKRQKHREQQARYRKQWYSDTAEAKGKSRHARAMPKKQRNGLPIISEVLMLPACLTACTWQKNQEPPVSGDGAGGSGEK